ncbi:MAG: hypothetical protein OXH23_03740 [bacterium]|nr:hypothetical protein [bacterium]
MVGIVAWGVFGRLERTVSAGCVVASPGERFAVLSNTTGTITEVLVEPGGAITAGQPIARVANLELDQQVRNARARIQILEEAGQETDVAVLLAQADLRSLEARQASGDHIISSHPGTLTWHGLSVGQAVSAGGEVAAIRSPGEGRVEVISVVSSSKASRLKPGMSGRVVVAREQESQVLDAVVVQVSEQEIQPPRWLEAFAGTRIPPRGHLVSLELSDLADWPMADGDQCSLYVKVRRDRPVSLLAGTNVADLSGPATL